MFFLLLRPQVAWDREIIVERAERGASCNSLPMRTHVQRGV